jgi:hypothetical protein
VQPDGLTLDVLIGLDGGRSQDLVALGQPLPRPVRARGVLDTGSDCTAVAPRVLQALGLSPSASVQTHTAGGLVQTHAYEVSLSVPPLVGASPMFTVPDLLVTELMHALPAGIEVLVGLDVLLQCVFTLYGPAGTFKLTF